jgi:hypothetical protein
VGVLPEPVSARSQVVGRFGRDRVVLIRHNTRNVTDGMIRKNGAPVSLSVLSHYARPHRTGQGK